MNKEFSLYLDLVRFAAALMVLATHTNDSGIISTRLPAYGHSAVMLFFVLSGFVIAYVTSTKEKQLRNYAISRLARIYSVVPVALLITLAADLIGQYIDTQFYAEKTTNDYFILRIFSSLAFLNELWNISITTFSNVAYWSLNYEVWYYIAFGIITFTRGYKRLILVLATVALLGPKVLLLAPIWWMGVYLYHSKNLSRLSIRSGWVLFTASIIAIVLFHAFDMEKECSIWLKELIGSEYYYQLAYSRRFVSDWLLGLLVMLNFAGFRAISQQIGGLFLPLEKPIRYVAGYTFVLYLTHQPLLWLYTVIIDGNPETSLYLWQVWACVIMTVWLIGQITEQQKGFYRKQAEHIVNGITELAVRTKLISRVKTP